MPVIELVIFDCDGVLIDSEPIGTAIMADDLANHGLNISPQDCAALFVGGTMQSAMDQAIARGADLPADWVQRINGKIADRLSQGVPVLPGLWDVLRVLDARGIGVAIASNGPQGKMRASLGPSGLWDYFAGRIHSGHDDGHPKPHPHMLIKAAAQADVPPERCVMIDDNIQGIRAAHAAGIVAVGLAADGDVARLAQPNTHVITRLAELPSLLDQVANTA